LGAGAALTDTTLRLIEHLFAPDQHDAVGALLTDECGTNLPFCETRDAVELERVRFAVLMLSDGDVNKLRVMVNQAKVDWRDVLVWAGFGYSLTAHERWAQAVLEH
jgi:Mg2+/Co2+ transporter CorC